MEAKVPKLKVEDVENLEESEPSKEIKLIPVDDCVIVEIEKITEMQGGIYLPPEVTEKRQMMIVEGILVKAGDFAFFDLINNGKEYPQVGNKVYFKRYSGILHTDEETQREFRIIQDQDIYCFERGNV